MLFDYGLIMRYSITAALGRQGTALLWYIIYSIQWTWPTEEASPAGGQQFLDNLFFTFHFQVFQIWLVGNYVRKIGNIQVTYTDSGCSHDHLWSCFSCTLSSCTIFKIKTANHLANEKDTSKCTNQLYSPTSWTHLPQGAKGKGPPALSHCIA